MNSLGSEEGSVIGLELPKKGVKETPKNADCYPAHYWDIAVLAVSDVEKEVSVDAVRDGTCGDLAGMKIPEGCRLIFERREERRVVGG